MFKLQATSGQARAGLLQTEHGTIETPVFMPVGTRGVVKSLNQRQLLDLNAQIILANTYHLYLRPGHELIERVGGSLHGFMNWKRPILTDSGGFQVFSLAQLNKVTSEGVHFQSHIDGSKHFFTPEKSMQVQKALGSDIVMVFDECPPLPNTKDVLRKSMELTLDWAKKCRDFTLRPYQKLFGIIQGGLELDLRIECMERLGEMNFDGLAIGGLSVGEKSDEMRQLLENFVPRMPSDMAHYLMGVGKPLDILQAVSQGVDMFDCVLPTRNARNGQAITANGPINIKNLKYLEDKSPLDEECKCFVCEDYSKSYIRHLFLVGEYTAGQLLTYHNLHFYLEMMKSARQAILEDRYQSFYQNFSEKYLAKGSHQ